MRAKLIKQGVDIVPFCLHCNNTYETIEHVFKDCEWAKKNWFMSPLGLKVENQVTMPIAKWCGNLLHRCQMKEEFCLAPLHMVCG